MHAKFEWPTIHLNAVTHNQHNTKKIKHWHHDLPCLPASSGSNFWGECNCHTSRNQTQSAKQGDAIFLCVTNEFFILFNINLSAADRHARGLKICFFCEYLCFFCRCFETTRTDPSYPPIFFWPMPLESLSCFGMILDKGGAALLLPCLQGTVSYGKLRVVSVVVR